MQTIKSSSEITEVFEEGRRIGASELSLIALKRESQHDREGRVAFIAGKKLGNAVWRNRAKRRMRAVCAQVGGGFPGYDVLFIARRRVNEVPFDRLLSQARKALNRAGIKYE